MRSESWWTRWWSGPLATRRTRVATRPAARVVQNSRAKRGGYGPNVRQLEPDRVLATADRRAQSEPVQEHWHLAVVPLSRHSSRPCRQLRVRASGIASMQGNSEVIALEIRLGEDIRRRVRPGEMEPCSMIRAPGTPTAA